MSAPSRSLRPLVLGWLALALGTVLVFSRAHGFGFINYDDPGHLVANPAVNQGLTRAGLAWAFAGRSDYWQPLSWISHMVDWQCFGANATAHRWVSVGWHALNAGLVFLLFRTLTGRLGFAWFAAALFAWHPLRVESVAWVTERKDVLSGFFFLLTLLAYVGYARRRAEKRPARGAYVAALLAFAAGLMSKPSLVTTPLVLLALDAWPLARTAAGWRALLREKIPFLLLSAAVSVITVLMQRQIGAFSLEVAPLDRLGNALVSLPRYLAHFLWPADLVFLYAHPGAWPAATVAGAAALVLALTAAAWTLRRRAPALLAGWLWFLALLLPMLGLLQVGLQAMADRYTYLATLGLELALLPAAALAARSRFVAPALAAAVLAGTASVTWRQLGDWRDSRMLYQRVITVDPRNPLGHAFVAFTELEAGNPAAAEEHARAAIALDATNQWAWLTLAQTQVQTGRATEAVASYAQLATLNPRSVRVQLELGLLLRRLGRIDEASAALDRAAELAPDHPVVLKNQAELLSLQRRFDASAAAYAHLVRVDPGNADAHAALGFLHLLAGRRADAAASWREALRLRPDFPGLRERLEQLER